MKRSNAREKQTETQWGLTKNQFAMSSKDGLVRGKKSSFIVKGKILRKILKKIGLL